MKWEATPAVFEKVSKHLDRLVAAAVKRNGVLRAGTIHKLCRKYGCHWAGWSKWAKETNR